MATSALPETLRSVTSTKIQELKKQRDQYEASKKQIIRTLKTCTNDLDRTRSLLEGACRQGSIHVVKDDDPRDDDSEDENAAHYPKTDVARNRRNQQLFLRQAGKDPAFTPDLVLQIHDDLAEHLRLKTIQHEHAQFFSELVTEWLSNPQEEKLAIGEGSLDDSAFESVGRKEMHEQRSQWESIVFTKSDINESEVQAYLDKLFKSEPPVAQNFKDLHKVTKDYCSTLRSTSDLFNVDQLTTTIKSLANADLLSNEKVAILKSFQNNPAVLQEVADVLNMRFTSLETWKWSTVDGAIPVEPRLALNKKYRIFMDEDILDALLLHTIGMKWAVHFRSSLTAFFQSPAWHTVGKGIPQADRDRRRYFLGEEGNTFSVDTKRKEQYEEDYFMSQLPISEAEGTRGYDSDETSATARKNPVETKQSLLHLLITEALVAKHLRPGTSHAVIQSDFQWFGPSLPHSTVFAVLKFFGVDQTWLDFFREFLQVPMRFVQDGPHGQIHVRQRGIPISHALSDVFGELILFVMDFAVNRSTQTHLYRLHDDFWFWGNEDVCSRGWATMTEFANVMGIQFNKEKTGSVVFDFARTSDHKIDSSSELDVQMGDETTPAKQPYLPQGDVRWGFLRLDSANTRFVIDQNMVDEHIKELQRQLSHCKSIFAYVQAYNSYLARFFTNNFGKPSYAFGRDHIDNMIETFARIENVLFPGGSVSQHLARIAQEKFGVKEIPDGVWYWPVEMGGLEVRNPLVPLFCMRETMRRSAQKILSKCLDEEERSYLKAKAAFDSDIKKYGRKLSHPHTLPSFGDEFMSKSEYLQHREQCSTDFRVAYDRLLQVPAEFAVHETKEIMSWLDKLPSATTANRSSPEKIGDFDDMTPYWRWILAVYGAQIVEKYGTLQIVDAAQVPLGVIGILKSGKIRWQG